MCCLDAASTTAFTSVSTSPTTEPASHTGGGDPDPGLSTVPSSSTTTTTVAQSSTTTTGRTSDLSSSTHDVSSPGSAGESVNGGDPGPTTTRTEHPDTDASGDWGILESPEHALEEDLGHDPRAQHTGGDQLSGRPRSGDSASGQSRGSRLTRSTVTPVSPAGQDPPPPPPPEDRLEVEDPFWSWNGQLAIVTDKIMAYVIITLVSIIMCLICYMGGSWIYCAYYHIGCCGGGGGQCASSSSSSSVT